MGPIALATESRLSAGILLDGGAALMPVLPEADESYFAPRVSAPVLMINGTRDFIFPVDSAQIPFFDSLGTSSEHKRHILYDSGHIVYIAHREAVVQDILEWLDRYLGQVD